MKLAQRTLAAVHFDQALLNARVDLIHADDGTPRILELELTEPSLIFAQAAGSAQRFVEAALKQVRTRRISSSA